MMKNFNSLTAKVSLNNLFNAHHIFGLYAFRINIYDDDLIKSPQVFKLNLYGDNLTTGIFAGRYMQSIMYNISHIVNKNNQGIELSIGELNYLKKLLKFYHKKFVNQSIKSIEIQVSPISYDNNKKKHTWTTFCETKIKRDKVNFSSLKTFKTPSHPFIKDGIPELNNKFNYSIDY